MNVYTRGEYKLSGRKYLIQKGVKTKDHWKGRNIAKKPHCASYRRRTSCKTYLKNALEKNRQIVPSDKSYREIIVRETYGNGESYGKTEKRSRKRQCRSWLKWNVNLVIVVSSEQNQIAKNVSMVVQAVLENVRNATEEVSRSHDSMIFFFEKTYSLIRRMYDSFWFCITSML